MKQFTLCMVCKDGKILLGMKKRGFGVGMWNGFGGKVLEGESIEEAASRELTEEAGIVALDMRKVGEVEFSFEEDPRVLEVHIFKATDYSGKLTESEEMAPAWFSISKIPYEQMWTSDACWLPFLLEDRPFKGKFHFDRPSDADYSAKILSKELEMLD